MKRIVLLLALLITASFLAAYVSSNAFSNPIRGGEEYYKYPITSDSPDWFDYTVKEKVEMLRISPEILEQMTDEQLVHAVADYPYIGDYATNNFSIEAGIKGLRNRCDALNELLNRPNGLQSLQKYGTELVQTNSTPWPFILEDLIDNLVKMCQP